MLTVFWSRVAFSIPRLQPPMREAFQDPTHVNIVTRETFSHYISGPTWARQYGFSARFELLFIGWRVGHLIALMQRES